MKTKSKIFITLLIAALCMPAQAQLGGLLNKAKDKAKEAATKEVKKQAEKKAAKVVGTESSSSSETQSSSSSDSQSNALPAFDANAKDIDEMLGVSMSALNKSYDNLSDIYMPSNRGIPGLYFTKSGNETSSEQDRYRQMILWMMTSGKDAPCIVYEPKPYAFCVLPADVIINANLAVFQAFPAQTYPLFMEARMLIHAMDKGKISIDYENPNTLVAFMKGNEIFFKLSDNVNYGFGFKNAFIEGAPNGNDGQDKLKKITEWKAEEARLMDLYRKHVPFENVKNTFFNTMIATVNASKEKKWYNGVYESYKLAVAAEDMKSHPKKVEDKDYKDGLAAYENLKANNYPKWEAFIKNEWTGLYAGIQKDLGNPNEIPKAGTSNPKLEAEMLALMKGYYNDGRIPVKAVIKGADWSYDRNVLGEIIDRYHTAYIIFKMQDGTHRMVDIGFKQMYNGGSYGKTQVRGVGTLNLNVDYK